MTGGTGNCFVAYVRPCKRCGRQHDRSMVTTVRAGRKRTYKAAHIENATAHKYWRDAELDQCDAWALELHPTPVTVTCPLCHKTFTEKGDSVRVGLATRLTHHVKQVHQ